MPFGTWVADAFIGVPSYRGRGLGAAALAALRVLIFGATLASAVAVRISIRHERHVRAIEKTGFRWHSAILDRFSAPAGS